MSCQIQATTINNEISDVDIDDILHELFPNQQDQFYHQQFRRASLRYHPHVLYKKASLKPIIGQNGRLTFSKRENE